MSDEERIFLDFEPNEMILCISPILDNRNNWTGELVIGTSTTGESTLNEDDHANLMHIMHMIAASIPAMEDNETVREVLSNYADASLQDTLKQHKKESAVVKEGNVIEVNFK